MQVLWNVIFDDKPKHTEQFYKLSDLVNKTSIYKKDKKMLKKNKKFLKQLSEEGTLFHFLFLSRAKHEDIAYFTALLTNMRDELELDFGYSASTVTNCHDDILRPLITRRFEIEYVCMIFHSLAGVLDILTLNKLINNIGLRNKTFVNWIVDPNHRPTPDKVNYLFDLLKSCIDYGYDITHVDDTNKDLYDSLEFYKGKEIITKLKQYMYLEQFDNFLMKLKGNAEHDKAFIEDVFGSIENADTHNLLDKCMELKLEIKDYKWIEPDTFIIGSIEKLLKAGLTPYSKEVNYILNYTLKLHGNFKKTDLEFIFKLIDISIKYGYDIDVYPGIFEVFRMETSNTEVWLEVYKFICKRGYNTYRSNFNFNCEPFDKLDDVFSKILRAHFNFNYNIDCLGEILLTKYNLVFEEQFKEKVMNTDKDIFKLFSRFTSIELNDKLAQLIYKKRQDSIDNSDPIVTVKEFIIIIQQLFSNEEITFSKATPDEVKKYLKVMDL